ncbi:MAG: OsmC family protein [Prolixibacteraceae bacterium]|nr:OsmC family protein [Prolixibacteraceae bacterium]
MSDKISINWKENMAFEADADNHKYMIDASVEGGGSDLGMRPKKLMLIALAGCSGMDVISILKKMKIEPASFDVKVEGELTEEHPKHYISMHIIYEFSGDNLPLEKLQRAVELSEERYCGVWAVYKKIMPVTWEIVIL